MTRHTVEGAGAASWAILIASVALAICLYLLVGCSTFGTPTPMKAWSAALTAYTSAAKTMTAYCAQPTASRDACVTAASASSRADLVILATKGKLSDPTASVTDAELAAATATINATIPLLQRAGGK